MQPLFKFGLLAFGNKLLFLLNQSLNPALFLARASPVQWLLHSNFNPQRGTLRMMMATPGAITLHKLCEQEHDSLPTQWLGLVGK
jgi:hypothetical protein